jgi:D-alanyl-D-alanine carboxypeptidase
LCKCRAGSIGPAERARAVRRRDLSILSLVAIFTTACSASSAAPPLATSAPAATAVKTAALATAAPATAAPAAAAPTLAPPTATPAPTEPPPTAIASPTRAPTAPAATNTPAIQATEVTAQPFDPALAADLQRILDETVANGSIPGAVLSVSIPGQAPWSGSSGVAARKTGQPMQPDTRVRIASISKVFTAVVILQLAQEGSIDLDAPLATWFPDLVPNADTITVRNLLNHTTGLYDYLEDRNFVNRAYRQPKRSWAPAELVEYATKYPAAFRPGAKGAWDYSSTNYVILGMIAEQVTGRSLAVEMRQRIFEPLGLTHTFFTPEEQIQGVRARGYSNAIDQTDAPMTLVFATANIFSTADDVRRFGEGLFNGRLLEPATLEMMETFVGGKGQYNMPALAYGLGVMRNRLPVGPGPDGQQRPAAVTTVMGHIGGYGGFRSALWFAPETGITFALGVNQAATDPNKLATRVFDAILTHQGR